APRPRPLRRPRHPRGGTPGPRPAAARARVPRGADPAGEEDPMSVGRCGICGAPTLTGAVCRAHWARLEELLDRAPDVAASLARGAARGQVDGPRSTTVALPISVPVMEAKTALGDALAAAIRVVCPGVPRLVGRDAVALLRAHSSRVRGSYAAPVLLVELVDGIS